jgi:glucose/arabinose dehydrogenase
MAIGARSLVSMLILALGASVTTPAPAQRDGVPSTAAARDQRSSMEELPEIRLSPAFPKLQFVRPVLLTHAGDDSNRLFVLEQPGRIRVFENRSSVDKAAVFLDIDDRVNDGGNEEGLLALAFHPRFKANRQFYVYYTAADPRRGVLSRFTVSDNNPSAVDPSTEQVILEVDQPYANHNGSTVLFGPDGYLYMSLGDGGAANDPHDHGQNMNSLLGKILRIDVDRADGERPYSIPADNPFVNKPGIRPEIWASGLRNVWRMAFDPVTDELWAGDVGQNLWEEVDLIVRGGNYGWNVREGAHQFELRSQKTDLSDRDFIDPIVEYPRSDGISITGGAVYRGKTIPGLVGAYVYGDYVTGRIWALRHENGTLTTNREILTGKPQRGIASFGEDAAGELYICAFDVVDKRGTPGRIFRVVPR